MLMKTLLNQTLNVVFYVTFKDRIKRCVSVLEQIEKYIQEERSEEETIQFIIKIEMSEMGQLSKTW